MAVVLVDLCWRLELAGSRRPHLLALKLFLSMPRCGDISATETACW